MVDSPDEPSEITPPENPSPSANGLEFLSQQLSNKKRRLPAVGTDAEKKYQFGEILGDFFVVSDKGGGIEPGFICFAIDEQFDEEVEHVLALQSSLFSSTEIQTEFDLPGYFKEWEDSYANALNDQNANFSDAQLWAITKYTLWNKPFQAELFSPPLSGIQLTELKTSIDHEKAKKDAKNEALQVYKNMLGLKKSVLNEQSFKTAEQFRGEKLPRYMVKQHYADPDPKSLPSLFKPGWVTVPDYRTRITNASKKWIGKTVNIFSLGYRLYRLRPKMNENRNAVMEVLATDVARARGMNVHNQQLILGTYQDGTPKIETITKLEPTFKDFEGRLGGSKRKWHHKIIDALRGISKRSQNRKYGNVILKVEREKDGKLKKVKQENGEMGPQFKTNDKGQFVVEDSIQGLGESFITLLSQNDFDVLGSKGSNKGEKLDATGNPTFFGIDFGHAYRKRDAAKSLIPFLQDDFSIPTSKAKQSGFKNLDLFSQTLITERMKGIYILARLAGKLDEKTASGKKQLQDIKEFYGDEFYKKLMSIQVNDDLKVFDAYIKKFEELAKKDPRYSKIVESVKYARKFQKDQNSEILKVFAKRIDLAPRELLLLDQLEKLTAKKITNTSNDGLVALSHLKVKQKDRVPWQIKSKTGDNYVLEADIQDPKELSSVRNLLSSFRGQHIPLSPPETKRFEFDFKIDPVTQKLEVIIPKEAFPNILSLLSKENIEMTRGMRPFVKSEARVHYATFISGQPTFPKQLLAGFKPANEIETGKSARYSDEELKHLALALPAETTLEQLVKDTAEMLKNAKTEEQKDVLLHCASVLINQWVLLSVPEKIFRTPLKRADLNQKHPILGPLIKAMIDDVNESIKKEERETEEEKKSKALEERDKKYERDFNFRDALANSLEQVSKNIDQINANRESHQDHIEKELNKGPQVEYPMQAVFTKLAEPGFPHVQSYASHIAEDLLFLNLDNLSNINLNNLYQLNSIEDINQLGPVYEHFGTVMMNLRDKMVADFHNSLGNSTHQINLTEFYAKMYEQAIRKQDYTTAYAIGAAMTPALGASNPSLLETPSVKGVLAHFNQLFNPSDNYKNYRDEIQNLQGVFVPFFPAHYQMILHLKRNQPNDKEALANEYNQLFYLQEMAAKQKVGSFTSDIAQTLAGIKPAVVEQLVGEEVLSAQTVSRPTPMPSQQQTEMPTQQLPPAISISTHPVTKPVQFSRKPMQETSPLTHTSKAVTLSQPKQSFDSFVSDLKTKPEFQQDFMQRHKLQSLQVIPKHIGSYPTEKPNAVQMNWVKMDMKVSTPQGISKTVTAYIERVNSDKELIDYSVSKSASIDEFRIAAEKLCRIAFEQATPTSKLLIPQDLSPQKREIIKQVYNQEVEAQKKDYAEKRIPVEQQKPIPRLVEAPVIGRKEKPSASNT